MSDANDDLPTGHDLPRPQQNFDTRRRPPVPGIKPPEALRLNPASIATDWKLFEQKWKNYATITHLGDTSDAYQLALLLHTLGDAALKIYNGFDFESSEEERTVAEVLARFKSFAVGKANETYERYMFNKRVQEPGESFDTFLNAIRNLIRTCNYCISCEPGILRDRIVLGIHNSNTQADLLKEQDLSLENAVNICKAAENAVNQYRTLHESNVNKMFDRARKPERQASEKKHYVKKKVPKQTPSERVPTNTGLCKFCGNIHELVKS